MSEGHFVALYVSDNGSGMPPEVVERAFDPLITTKPIGERTGLGLSMIYGFAKQAGGQVRNPSRVGVGTSVSIFLPRHYGAAEADESSLSTGSCFEPIRGRRELCGNLGDDEDLKAAYRGG